MVIEDFDWDDPYLDMVARILTAGDRLDATNAVRAMRRRDQWREFVTDRLGFQDRAGASPGRLAAADEGRNSLLNTLEADGIRTESRFVRGTVQTQFRDLRSGAFVSASTVADRVRTLFGR